MSVTAHPTTVGVDDGSGAVSRHGTRWAHRRGRDAMVVLAVVLLGALLGVSLARAAGLTFAVNSTADRVDAAPGDGVCQTATAGECTLRAAIQEANADTGHDTVTVPAGVFEIAIPPEGLNLGESGDHDVTAPLTITGAGSAATVIDAGTPDAGAPPQVRGLDRVLEIHPGAGNVRVTGLTLREGYAAEYGGALQSVTSGTVRLEQVAIIDSFSGKWGGGVNNAAAGRLELVGTTVSGNGAIEGGAAVNNQTSGTVSVLAGSAIADNPGTYLPGPGAIQNQADGGAVGTIRVVGATVADNTATQEGSAISNADDGTVVVERSTISGNSTIGNGTIYTASGTLTAGAGTVIEGNTAGNGGGIYSAGALQSSAQPALVTVTGATIRDNVATGSGGGVSNGGDGNLTLVGASLSGNTAAADGGAVAHSGRGKLVIDGGTYAGNSADAGGAVTAHSSGTATITGGTFTGNSAGADGGGAIHTEGTGAVTITGGVVDGNTATGDGGGLGIHSFGTVLMTGTTVRDNKSTEGGGGGVENSAQRVTLTALRVTGNTAAGDGGGIQNTSSGVFSIIDSHVADNLAANGGGFANVSDANLIVRGSLFLANTARVAPGAPGGHGGGIFSSSDGDSVIDTSTVSSNNASTNGGGVYHNADGGLRMTSVTIWRNSAPLGGGFALEAGIPTVPPTPDPGVVVRNTIIGGSLSGGSCDGAIVSEGGSIDGGVTCYLRGPNDRSNAPAGLDAIADNGGPTLTHALRAESLATENGVSPCPEVDQRGIPRPQNAQCDAGAFEFEGTPAPPDTIAPHTTFLTGPVQDSPTTSAFTFTGTDDRTPVAQLSYECRLFERDPTVPVPPADPTLPPNPAWEPCGSPWQVPLIAAGSYRLEVRALDHGGNLDLTPAVHDFTQLADATDPDTVITEAPVDGTSNRTATFTFTGSDNLTPAEFVTFQCRFDTADPQAWAECTNPITYPGLASGEHTFEVRAVDTAGNNDASAARHTWTIGAPATCNDANVTLGADQDVTVDIQTPGDNRALDPALAVRSGAGGTGARTLIRFALPADAPTCLLESATLRLNAQTSTPDRTLHAVPLAASWSQSTVTWNNQPPTVGTPAATGSGAGYREWDVTAQVSQMLAGDLPSHGFQIRDAVEGQAGDQSFTSTETPQSPGNPTTVPQVVLLYAADATAPPAPPVAASGETTVICGQVLTQSTRLANNLLDCPVEGLVIGAPDIHVDLNGHTVDSGHTVVPGQESGLPVGIRNAGHDNVVITGGTVSGFGYGIALLPGTAYNLVEGMTLTGNLLSGIELDDADNGRFGNTIRDNDLVANSGGGVALVGGSVNSVVTGNRFQDNGNTGVLVSDSDGHEITGNQISGFVSNPLLGSDAGIYLTAASNNLIAGNVLTSVGDAGILLGGASHRNRIEANVVTRTSDAGISVGDSDESVIIGNTTHQNGGAGISVSGNNHVIRGNDVRFNPGGIQVGGDGNQIEANDASESRGDGISLETGVGNQFVNNIANRTKGTGLAIGFDAVDTAGNPLPGNIVIGNTAHQNSATGISVASGGHTVTANAAHNNAAFGISAGSFVADGGANTAAGNREAVQCVGVVCAGGTVPLVTADLTPPTAEITTSPPALDTSTSGRFEFVGADDTTPLSALRFECRIDPGPDPAPVPDPDPIEPGEPVDPPVLLGFTACASPFHYDLPAGPHRFEVRALDQADNRSHPPMTFDWAIEPRPDTGGGGGTPGPTVPDTVEPDTRILDAPTNPTTDDLATFRFSGSDDATPGSALTFACSLDGSPFAACTTPQTYLGLADGPHTFQVRAIDRSGNVDPTPAVRSWTINAPPPDLTGPTTTITAGPDANTVATTATFTFTADEAGSTFECRRGSDPFAPCTSPHELTGLAVGPHVFEVRATDQAANTGAAASAAWTVGAAPVETVVSCGQVLVQSTRLVNDLLNCPVDGLVIGADAITVDLGGFTVDGIGQGTGVRNAGFDSVTVTDGTVQGFDVGVGVTGGRYPVVSGLTVTANQVVGVLLADADDSVVRGGSVTANASGLTLTAGTERAVVRDVTVGATTGDGVRIDGANGNRIEASRISGSSGSGVVIVAASGNVVIGTTVTGSSVDGIAIGTTQVAADGNRVEANTIEGGGGNGIQVTNSAGTELVGNTVVDTSATAILLDDAHDGLVSGNSATLSPGGITLTGSTGNRLEANTASENSGNGIALGNLSLANVVTRNLAHVNTADGIAVTDTAAEGAGSLIDANRTDGNVSDGISVSSTGHTITANSANDNGSLGIAAVQGAAPNVNVDGGGNRAAGNTGGGIDPATGETVQCSGVRCNAGDDAPPAASEPDTVIVDRPADPSSSSTALFTFTGSDDTAAPFELTFQCRLDSGIEADFVACQNPQSYLGLVAGSHTFEVRAVDPGGIVDPTPAAYSWLYVALPAGVAPDTIIDTAPPAQTNAVEALFTFSSDEPDVTFECRLDAAAFAPCAFGVQYTVEAGPHTFEVRATDAEGNTDATPAVHTWRVLAIESLITSAPEAITESTTATFVFESTVEGATFVCALDVEAFTPCTSPLTYPDLGIGARLFRVIATDPATGRTEEGAAEHRWTIVLPADVEAPDTVLGTTPTDGTPEVEFTFTGSDNLTPPPALGFQCRLDSADELAFVPCTSPHNLLVTLPGFAPGPHVFEVRAVDVAGNADPSPASYPWTSTPDVDAPTVELTATPPAVTASFDAVFAFTGADAVTPQAQVTYECSLDGAAFTACTSPHTLLGLGLAVHTLQVQAVDLAGNRSAPASYTWSVEALPVTTILTGPDPSTEAMTATFTFASSRPDVTFVCSLDRAAFVPCISPVGYAGLALGTHRFEVLATTTAGLVEAHPAAVEWTVVDITFPVVTIVSGPADPSPSQHAAFVFSATEPVTYSCSLDGAPAVPCSSPIEYSGLAAGPHQLVVTGADVADNISEPATHTWTIQEPAGGFPTGTPPPPAPAAVATTVTCGQVLTESTLVANDLVDCPGEGLVVGAGNIVVDLGGRVIDGPNYFGRPTNPEDLPAGIRNSGFDNVVIRGGTVREFGHGVAMEAGSAYGVVENLTLVANSVMGVELADADNGTAGSIVRTSTLLDNGGGLRLSSGTQSATVVGNTLRGNRNSAIHVVDTSQSRVESNLVDGLLTTGLPGSDVGILLEGANSNVLISNTITDTGDGGILLYTSNANLIEGNTMTRSGDSGVGINASADNQVLGNTARELSDVGVSLSGSTGTLVRGNDLRFNPGGIQVDGSSDNRLESNDTSGSGGPGIELGVDAGRNVVIGNISGDNGAQGIYVSESPPPGEEPIVIERNRTDRNRADGILLAKGGHIVTANTANDNLGHGINAGLDSVDGGGNTASGNLGPAQCVGVVCTVPDTTAPETVIDSGPQPMTSDTGATFVFSANEAGATFMCALDGAAFAACASPVALTGLALGDHEFRVVATDAAGNADATPALHQWEIVAPPDTVAPDTTFTSAPATGTATTATFTFTSTEPGTFECSLDGAAYTTCTSPRVITGLGLGAHTFAVRARDAAGNLDQSPAAHGWTVQSSCTAPGSVTVSANADSWIHQKDSTKNFGGDSILKVTTKSGENTRALVRLGLPAVPAGCSLTSAVLRLHNASPKPGSIQVLRLTGSWTEGGVTWANQPATTGPAVAATTPATAGRMSWTVTAQVQAMLAPGANHGFLVRTANEGTGDAEQQFHAREKGQEVPQLVITFG